MLCCCCQVGYPLVTVLVCLVNDANYPRFLDAMADFLVKQMKVTLPVKCSCGCSS